MAGLTVQAVRGIPDAAMKEKMRRYVHTDGEGEMMGWNGDET